MLYCIPRQTDIITATQVFSFSRFPATSNLPILILFTANADNIGHFVFIGIASVQFATLGLPKTAFLRIFIMLIVFFFSRSSASGSRRLVMTLTLQTKVLVGNSPLTDLKLSVQPILGYLRIQFGLQFCII